MSIQVKNLCKNYDAKTVLSDLNISFEEGRVNVLMGPSGRGKTTLLNILIGLEEPDSGEVIIDRDSVAVVFQEDRLCESFSALSNVKLTAGEGFTEERVKELLTKLGLGEELYTKVCELSGGMKRRVAIARAIAANKKILIMDEPFNGLDEDTKKIVAEVLKALECTVIMVTHNEKEVELMSGILYRM